MTYEEIKSKIEYGDYNTLQHLLNAKTVAAARMKFLRGDEDAIQAMKAIQENREELIKNYNNDEELIKDNS